MTGTKLTEFWSNIRNVESATPENIQSDILAYLEKIESLQQQVNTLTEALEEIAEPRNIIGKTCTAIARNAAKALQSIKEQKP